MHSLWLVHTALRLPPYGGRRLRYCPTGNTLRSRAMFSFHCEHTPRALMRFESPLTDLRTTFFAVQYPYRMYRTDKTTIITHNNQIIVLRPCLVANSVHPIAGYLPYSDVFLPNPTTYNRPIPSRSLSHPRLAPPPRPCRKTQIHSPHKYAAHSPNPSGHAPEHVLLAVPKYRRHLPTDYSSRHPSSA